MEKNFNSIFNIMNSNMLNAYAKNDFVNIVNDKRNSLGQKRFYPYYHSIIGSTEGESGNNNTIDPPPDYPETNVDNIGDPFDPVGPLTFFRLTSLSDLEWTVYVFDYNTNVFSEFIQFEGRHLWIGSLQNSTLTNGLHILSIEDFNDLIKSGLYKNQTNERLFKENLFSRNYDVGITPSFYFKMNNLYDSFGQSFGLNNYRMRTQRLEIAPNKIFIAVKYATAAFQRVNPLSLVYTDWNEAREIDIDATEYDVMFASLEFSSNQSNYQSFEVDSNSNNTNWSSFIYNSTQYNKPFTFFTQNYPFVRDYVVGVEERQDMFLNVQSNYVQVASTPRIRDHNNFIYDYNSSIKSFNMGNTLNYASAFTTSETIVPPSLVNTILVRNTLLKITTSLIEPDWRLSSETVNNGGTSGSLIHEFATDPDSGLKVNLQPPNLLDGEGSYYLPSKFIGNGAPSNTTSMAFEFDLPPFSTDVYLGVINQVNPDVTTTSSFDPSNDIRVNLVTGQIEIGGQNVGAPLVFLDQSIVIVSLSYLQNGNVLVNIGNSEDTMQTFTVQAGGALTDPRFFLTGDNLNSGTLGTFKQIPVEALVGATNNIPSDVTYPPTVIDNIGDPFNEASTSGTFLLSSNNINEWSVIVLDASYNIFAGQMDGEGVEMYIGVFHGSSLSNGLNTVLNNDFISMNKSGVNFKFTPNYSQKIYKENVFSRDLDIFLTPTVYFKLTNLNTSTCMSIGINDYNMRNVKLLNAPNKFFIGVRKGTISYSKISAYDLTGDGWDTMTDASIDATDYDVEFADVAIDPESSTLATKYLLQTNNPTDYCDMYISTNPNVFTFRDAGSSISNYYLKNEGKIACTLNKNGTELNVGNSLNTLVGSNYYFRYYNQHSSVSKRNAFLGSSETQYTSCYFDSDISLSTYIRFSIVFKTKVYTLSKGTLSSSSWKDNVDQSFSESGTIGSPSTNALSILNYNTKNSFNTPSGNFGTVYLPSVFVGTGTMVNPATFCFEFDISSTDIVVGIKNRSQQFTEIVNTYEGVGDATINLSNGVCSINGISSTKTFGGTKPSVFVVSCRKLPEGLLVSMGSSGENATQAVLIPNTTYDNVCLYITGASLNVVNGHIITLKRITLPGVTGYTDEIPLEPQLPPSSNDPLFTPFFVSNSSIPTYTLNESFSVTNTANNWNFIRWEVTNGSNTDNICTYAEYTFTPYSNQTMEWFIGTVSNSSSLDASTILPLEKTYYTITNTNFNSHLKYGIYFNGTSINYLKGNVVERPFSFPNQSSKRILFEFVKRPSNDNTYNGAIYRVGSDNMLANNLGRFTAPFGTTAKVHHVIAVKYGSVTLSKKPPREGIKLGFNQDNLLGENRISSFTSYAVDQVLIKGMAEQFNTTREIGFYYKNNDLTQTTSEIVFYNTPNIGIGYNQTIGNHFGLHGKGTYLSRTGGDINSGAGAFYAENNLYPNVYYNVEGTRYFIFTNTKSASQDYPYIYAFGNWGNPITQLYTYNFTNLSLNAENLIFRVISAKKFGVNATNYYYQIGDGKEVRTLYNSTQISTPDGLFIPVISANMKDVSLTRMAPQNLNKWFSDYSFVFNSTTPTINSVNTYYFYGNSQFSTKKLLLQKSHTGNSVTFRSAILAPSLFTMQYEILDNQDIYFGIMTDTGQQGTGQWEYSQSYTDPSTMIAYVNLSSLQSSIRPNSNPYIISFTSNDIKVLHVEFTKSLTTTTFLRFNHFVAPAINEAVTTSGHTGTMGYRYVITCQNVTNDNVIMFNTFNIA